MSAARVFCVGLWLCAGLAACGDGSDPSTGTGSSGGNPLVIGFDTDLSSSSALSNDRPDPQNPLDSLQQPLVAHIGEMSIARLNAEGECPDVNGGEAVEVDFLSNREEVLTIKPPAPCAILLKPPVGEPLLTFQILRLIELGLPQGMIIEIEDPAGLEATLLAQSAQVDPEADFQNIFIIFDMPRFIANFGLALLQPDTPLRDTELNSADRDKLWSAVLSSTFVYLDPTPGDGLLAQEERSAQNRIATIRLNDEMP